jgi:hypothetical protein
VPASFYPVRDGAATTGVGADADEPGGSTDEDGVAGDETVVDVVGDETVVGGETTVVDVVVVVGGGRAGSCPRISPPGKTAVWMSM